MTEATLKKLGAEFRKARLAKGLTQKAVADAAGLNPNRYAVIERGVAKNITVKTLEELTKVLDVKGKDILPF